MINDTIKSSLKNWAEEKKRGGSGATASDSSATKRMVKEPTRDAQRAVEATIMVEGTTASIIELPSNVQASSETNMH